VFFFTVLILHGTYNGQYDIKLVASKTTARIPKTNAVVPDNTPPR
jgi:hypothetical protein